eukprot:TRINITY_DN7332_c0_g1_i1.p1 TRINITY_DN7332_c0_g1~~TRINITY_DN7332_c0_g1_i1.p1  ORF type:complete len:279 (+),score=50.92 TRINITY_DN7332_c0_g1_i1:74-910(+)
MKRVPPMRFQAPPAKMMKAQPRGPMTQAPPAVGQAQQPQGENWACNKCGNENWPQRTICNRKGCGNIGPWSCHGCGNQNFQGRPNCNKCGRKAPVPASKAAALGVTPGGDAPAVGGLDLSKLGLNLPPGAAQNQAVVEAIGQLVSALGGQAPAAAAPSGGGKGDGKGKGPNWTCMGCGNVNWPLRSKCNKCSMPRDKAEAGKQGSPPEGSWICSNCANVNYPSRTTCNSCQTAREQADGGSPHRPGANPEGSWNCPSCNNVNWPLRSSCNSCGAPRAF